MTHTKSLLATLALLGNIAWAADVTFASGLNCTGQALYGSKGLKDVACYDITDFNRVASVVLADLEPDQEISIFSDGSCQQKTYSTSSDSCYTAPEGRIGSFKIESKTTAAPVTSKDMVPYGVKLSNYTGLAIMDPGSVDIRYSNFFIGLALSTTSGALSLYAAVVACQAISGPDPVAILACIAVPLASIISFAGSYFFGQAGRTVNHDLEMGTGTFTNARKRSLIDDVNYDYMSGALNWTSLGAEAHVGYAKRDMGYGEQTSPIYEVAIGDIGKWHMSAFLDEDSGQFVHHIRSAEESALPKRSSAYSYNTVRWGSGGFDFHFCFYSASSPRDGYSLDLEGMYQTAYDQLTCLATTSQFEAATKVGIDLYNEEGTIIGELEIIPYSGSSKRTPPNCASKTTFPVDQDCIIT